MSKPKATLIISVYNNVLFLKTVLDSVKIQTFKDFEIIISEDARHDEMKAFVEGYQFENTYQHLVQDDIGWRKNIALNRAILASKSDYLIFIDGDCVLHPRFIENHIQNSRENRLLGGKRLFLNEEFSLLLIKNNLSSKDIERYLLLNLLHLQKEGIRCPEEGIFVKPKSILGFIPFVRNFKNLTGCNMSFSKKAILSINGFDEDYKLPAVGEDLDIAWRFFDTGYQLYSVRNLAVQYHLYHKENWVDQSLNLQIMQDKKKIGNLRCLNGIEKLKE